MSELLLLSSANIILSWQVAAWVIKHAAWLRLVQVPNHRSSHENPIPAGGGLGIILAALITAIWLTFFNTQAFPYEGLSIAVAAVAALALPLAVVGFADDRQFVSLPMRLGVQAASCVGLLIWLGALPGIDLSLFPIVEGNKFVIAGSFLMVLLFLAGVWWVNLFNFMDGIDGIAGVEALFLLLAGATFSAWVDPGAMHTSLWIWMVCIAASIAGFLLLNWPPAKIFMGDAGSTWLAFVLFAYALLSIQAQWMTYTAWLILAAFFITDATITLLARIANGDRWYEAHRSHAYQRLSRRWQGERNAGHRSVTLLVSAVNLGWLAPLAWLSLKWPQWSFLWLVLAYLPLVVAVVKLGAGKRADITLIQCHSAKSLYDESTENR